MEKITKDFYSTEKRNFKWAIGRVIASSLSGFIVGIIVTIIVFYAFFDIALKS